jgi:hypothetical protein
LIFDLDHEGEAIAAVRRVAWQRVPQGKLVSADCLAGGRRGDKLFGRPNGVWGDSYKSNNVLTKIGSNLRVVVNLGKFVLTACQPRSRRFGQGGASR